MTEPCFTSDWFSHNIPRWKIWLSEFIDEPCKALEIGSYEGRSAIWLCENILTNKDSFLICIDPYKNITNKQLSLDMNEAYSRFSSNTKELQRLGKIYHLNYTSHYILPKLSVELNFIYIDGSHNPSDVLIDSVYSWRLLANGGIMIFDDYEWSYPINPKPAIDAFLNCFEGKYELIDKCYQVAVRKK